MDTGNILGLIFSENPEASLGELTASRSPAAVPVGGRYRIIDFILSDMVNSGIDKVGITTGMKNRSLTDHLGSGKDWDLARKQNGLFIISPTGNADGGNRRLNGVDYINNAMSYLKRSSQEYVMVCDCNTICSINFEDVAKFHFEKGADVTMVCTEVGELAAEQLAHHIMLGVDEDGGVTDIQLYPKRQKTNLSYMHMMLIRKELLIEITDDCLAHDKHSISRDILLANLKKLRFFGYRFDGYRKKIDSIRSFFEFNLDMLKPELRKSLFGDEEKSVYTKVKDSVPTRYGTGAAVSNSFIADGCTIEGTVENSVIFRGVKIGRGSKIKNAVIMQNSQIMDNCSVENAVFDKEVILRSGKKLMGQGTYPLVIGKRTIV